MEILTVDRTDDALLTRLHHVQQRSNEASRVAANRRTAAEFIENVRFEFPGEREETAMAVVDGEPAALARLYFPERDNLDKCWFELFVDPAQRGRGIGSSLVTWAEQRAKEGGRQLVLVEAFVPAGGRDEHPVRRFALERGYAVSSIEIVRRLSLPTAPGLVETLHRDARAAMGDTYTISIHHDGVPEELRQGVCDASNRLILDAPTGEVDFEPESMTPEDYERFLEHHRATGMTMITAVALHEPTGVVAAYTDLAIPSGDRRVVYQFGTLVLPEHRGHRLGMAVKATNLLELARTHPERQFVETMNDEENPWMVQINKDLGFEVIEEVLTLKKDL